MFLFPIGFFYACFMVAGKGQLQSSARKMHFSLGWNRAGAQTPASISSSRLQDRNFTGTVYNCALYSKGFWTLLRS